VHVKTGIELMSDLHQDNQQATRQHNETACKLIQRQSKQQVEGAASAVAPVAGATNQAASKASRDKSAHHEGLVLHSQQRVLLHGCRRCSRGTRGKAGHAVAIHKHFIIIKGPSWIIICAVATIIKLLLL
jgi:hypothetical protein